MFHVEQNLTQINRCPVCGNSNFEPYIACADYTVSKKEFSIVLCTACKFALTSPRPADETLGAYYESEDYISHSNTKKGLVSRLYQSVRKHTLKKKLALVNREGSKGALLDIGCGTGEFLNVCKLDGWNVIGIEPSASARAQGRQNYGLDVRDEDALAQLPAHTYDVISMWHVLEHVPYLEARVEKLKELLKPGGVIIIAVPNRSSHDAEHYGKFWAAYDVPRHLWHFRPQDIRALMQKTGLELVSILPMKFDSYYVSMLSEKYKTGNSRLIAAAWRGWISNRKAGTEKWSSQIYIIRNKK